MDSYNFIFACYDEADCFAIFPEVYFAVRHVNPKANQSVYRSGLILL